MTTFADPQIQESINRVRRSRQPSGVSQSGKLPAATQPAAPNPVMDSIKRVRAGRGAQTQPAAQTVPPAISTIVDIPVASQPESDLPFWKGVRNALGRTVGRIGRLPHTLRQAVGAGVADVGAQIEQGKVPILPRPLNNLNPTFTPGKKATAIGGTIRELGKQAIKGDVLQQAQTATADALSALPKSKSAEGFKPGKVKWWTENVTEIVPYLALTIATGGVAGAAGASAALATTIATLPTVGLEGQEALLEMTKALEAQGVPRDEAMARATPFAGAVGLVNGAMERLPASELLTDGPIAKELRSKLIQYVSGKLAVRAARGGAVGFTEGVTEVGQELTQVLGQYAASGDTKVFEGLGIRLAAAGTLGTGVGAVVGSQTSPLLKEPPAQPAPAHPPVGERVQWPKPEPNVQPAGHSEPAPTPAATEPKPPIQSPPEQPNVQIENRSDEKGLGGNKARAEAPRPTPAPGETRIIKAKLERATLKVGESMPMSALDTANEIIHNSITQLDTGDRQSLSVEAFAVEPDTLSVYGKAAKMRAAKMGIHVVEDASDVRELLGDKLYEQALEEALGGRAGRARIVVDNILTSPEYFSPQDVLNAFQLQNWNHGVGIDEARAAYRPHVDPKTLKAGDSFMVMGRAFEVIEKDGTLGLASDSLSANLRIDGLTDPIPIDRGSFEKASSGVKTDLFGKPFVDPATGEQQGIPFAEPSQLDKDTKAIAREDVEGQQTFEDKEPTAYQVTVDDPGGSMTFASLDKPTEADLERDFPGAKFRIEPVYDEGETLGLPDPTDAPPDPILSSIATPSMPMRLQPPSGAVKAVRAPKVIQALAAAAEAFGRAVPIRVGRFMQHALGIFKVRPEVVRIKTALDIPTSAHEFGHAIEKIVFGWPRGGPWKNPTVNAAIQAELVKLGRALYGSTNPVGGYKREGFAEFIRLWITDRPKAQADAPQFFQWFESDFLKRHKKGAKALQHAADLSKRWQEQGSVERAKQSVVDTGSISERASRVKGLLKRATSFETHIDMLQPLAVMAKAAQEKLGRPLLPSENPFVTGSALRTTHDARVAQMVDSGMIDLAGNVVGPPLADIRGLVKSGERQDFTIYLWAKRAEAMHLDPKGPRNPGLTLADAKQIIAELETPNFQLAAKRVYDWNDGVLNYAAQASPSFKAVVDAIRKRDPGHYIPLARSFGELDEVILNQSGGANARGGSLSARLRGSGREIKDPIPQMITNASQMVRAAHDRLILDQMIRLSKIEGMGHLIEKVPKDRVPVLTRSVEELIDTINRQLASHGGGVAVDPGTADLVGESITFFVPAKTPKGQDPIIPIYNDGKIEWYQMERNLFHALDSMRVYRLPDIVGLPILDFAFGKFTRMFRAGTTGLRASFGLVTNPLRDFQQLWTNSQTSANAVGLFAAWSKSMWDGLIHSVSGGHVKNQYTDAFIRLGGQMAQPLGQDIQHTRRAGRRVFQGWVIKTLDLRNWFDSFRDIIQFPESAARTAELRTLAKDVGWQPGQPMTLDQSLTLLLASKQVTVDFSAAGEFARTMNQVGPFYNAAIQGPRAAVRAAGRTPATFFIRGLELSAISLAHWWRYKDEEWYKEMSANEKFLNWHFPVEIDGIKTLVRIARSLDIGMVFAALPEAIADAAYRQNPEAMREWFETLAKVGTPNVTPVLLEETLEQAENVDSFWKTPIVSQSLENKPPEEQFDEHTTTAAIALGDIFNVSPKRIDHAIRGIAGPVGGDLLEILGIGPKDSDQEREAADMLIIGRLFQRGGELGTRPKSIDKLYDVVGELKQAQHSTKTPETPELRQARLQMEDASKAVSALLYVRSQTPGVKERNALTATATEIARDALEAHAGGKSQRGKSMGTRKLAEGLANLRKIRRSTDLTDEQQDQLDIVEDELYAGLQKLQRQR